MRRFLFAAFLLFASTVPAIPALAQPPDPAPPQKTEEKIAQDVGAFVRALRDGLRRE